MQNTSTVGMSVAEKVIAVLLPIVLGIVGWYLPKLLDFIKEIPFLSDSLVLRLLELIDPFWLSILLLIAGFIIGVILAFVIYREALKMSINDQEILIDKDDHKQIIKKSEIKEIYMDDQEVVITGHHGEELLRERTEVARENIRNIFLDYHYPWCDQDPYKDEFSLWTLGDHTLGEKANSILYERRKAIREKDEKKAKNLRMDLKELGVIVKDQGENQYVRTTRKITSESGK